MRDAAAAAAMSDPERNRWFRRRWVESAPIVAHEEMTAEPINVAIDRLGQELLADWRRERSLSGYCSQ